MAASGSFVHIVWASVGSLYYICSEDGGASWGAASQITYVNQHPSIAVSGTDLHVVWTFSTGNFEIFYKRNPTGNIGITTISSEIPASFSLYQNYPNPFNPSTKIRFDVPPERNGRDRSLQIIIYDMLGREIAVLVNENLNPGTYEVDWDAADYPSGVYLCRLETDKFNDTRKLILLK
ncbi:MAG: T9SS type A sorting domain-containing protein [Ignavibacteria bacterium]|nr:T9SS type A sorting domain-containing protein [Ignavibacteria bacterium]